MPGPILPPVPNPGDVTRKAKRGTKAAATQATTAPSGFDPSKHKLALVVGAALAIAVADTRVAPLAVAVLIAGIVYQLVNLAGSSTTKGT